MRERRCASTPEASDPPGSRCHGACKPQPGGGAVGTRCPEPAPSRPASSLLIYNNTAREGKVVKAKQGVPTARRAGQTPAGYESRVAWIHGGRGDACLWDPLLCMGPSPAAWHRPGAPPPPPTESESTLDKTRGDVHARQGWRRATLVPCGQDVSDVGNHLEGFSNMQIPQHRLSHSPMTSSGGAGRPSFVNQQLGQV